jgi:hypothetical protein
MGPPTPVFCKNYDSMGVKGWVDEEYDSKGVVSWGRWIEVGE